MASHPSSAGSRRSAAREEARRLYRRAILEAAEEIFARRGFAGARMTDIAEAAGFATGTIYNYYRSKDDVFRCLLVERGEEMIATLEEAAASCQDPSAGGDPEAPLRALVRFTLGFLERHRGLFAVFTELGAHSEAAILPIGGQQAQKMYERFFALVEGLIRRLRDAGLLRDDVPPHDLAAVLTGAMNGTANRWMVQGSAGALSDRGDVVVDLFLRGAGEKS